MDFLAWKQCQPHGGGNIPDIRYVCLSDLHFGEEDSLLTNLKEGSHDLDASRPSPVMKHLVECLKYLIFQNEIDKKPVLILNGDILELALSTTNQAVMVFQRFIELILPSNTALFEKIIYIPGILQSYSLRTLTIKYLLLCWPNLLRNILIWRISR